MLDWWRSVRKGITRPCWIGKRRKVNDVSRKIKRHISWKDRAMRQENRMSDYSILMPEVFPVISSTGWWEEHWIDHNGL